LNNERTMIRAVHPQLWLAFKRNGFRIPLGVYMTEADYNFLKEMEGRYMMADEEEEYEPKEEPLMECDYCGYTMEDLDHCNCCSHDFCEYCGVQGSGICNYCEEYEEGEE
jgi:hypothetical protein